MFVLRLVAMSSLVSAAFAQGTAERRFDALMRDLLIVDTHVDTPGYVVDEGYRLADEHRYYEADIPRLRRGHVGAVFFGVYVQPQDFAPHLWLGRTLEWIDAIYEETRRNPRDLEAAATAADIVRIHRAGGIAVVPSLEGGFSPQNAMSPAKRYRFSGSGLLSSAATASLPTSSGSA